jgi:hypothetical protein
LGDNPSLIIDKVWQIARDSIVSQRRDSMCTPNSSTDNLDNALPEWHEPFPKPQTIPAGWDMSGLQPGPVTTSAMEAESDAED